MDNRTRWVVWTFVALHTALLVAYTFPAAFVPLRIKLLAQVYVAPFFHQQWTLFAPDPPLCSCAVESRIPGTAWASIDDGSGSAIRRRTVQNIARYVQAGVHAGDTLPAAPLVQALRNSVRSAGIAGHPFSDGTNMEFRLVEQCVSRSNGTFVREERITPLHTP
jgi:hypothetical protein